ncbi:MAG: hypothetical protein U1E81_20225 [Xanthobacteraceae bacterium]
MGQFSVEKPVLTGSALSGNQQPVRHHRNPHSAAQARAAAQNDAMISDTIATGERNLGLLERTVLKDNTLFPGEWYGGQLHIQPPVSDTTRGPKRYSLAVVVGDDRHEIDIVQSTSR